VLETFGNWSSIRYSETRPKRGWIASRYLKHCPDRQVALPVESETLNALKQLSEVPPGFDPLSHGPDLSPEKLYASTPLKICWWNAKRLGHGKSRNWKATARAVRGCDVVGLGEVMTTDAAERLARHMGYTWRAATSSKAVGAKGYREFSAVVYASHRVELVKTGVRGFYPDDEDDFAREPWAVTMKAGSFDFTLVLLQLSSGDTAAERIAELRHVDDAYQHFQEADPEEQDVIIVGDFRRSPWATGWEQIAGLGLRTLIGGVKTNLNSEGEGASLYDQMSIDPRHASEWTGKAGAITVSGDEALEYRKTVSDHVPVWATFEVSGEDDD